MQLYPSMMCADYRRLEEEVRALDAAGADSYHCDVMDGSFVPNFAMGTEDIRAIRAMTDTPIDVHLMVENPLDKLDLFIALGANVIYIHPESERYVSKVLLRLREAGVAAGLVINPDTSLASVEEVLPLADYVLAMTVNPGFAGQSFLEFTLPKLERLAQLKRRLGFTLVADGACSPQRIEQLSGMGVDAFVLGTSALFGKGDYTRIMSGLRALEKGAADADWSIHEQSAVA